jgi:hypothetical protein
MDNYSVDFFRLLDRWVFNISLKNYCSIYILEYLYLLGGQYGLKICQLSLTGGQNNL